MQDIYLRLLRTRRSPGSDVLKPHLQSTVFTLLERNKSQRQIQELTGIDRKTIRRYQAIFESEKSAAANSSIGDHRL